MKVVIRLSLSGNGRKCRTKAIKIAASQSGVESAAIKGDEKNQLEVVGVIDTVALIVLLRKNLGQADVVSMGPAAAAVVQSQPASYYYGYPSPVTDSYGQSCCSMLDFIRIETLADFIPT